MYILIHIRNVEDSSTDSSNHQLKNIHLRNLTSSKKSVQMNQAVLCKTIEHVYNHDI